jgi:signal transduction histidine kinase
MKSLTFRIFVWYWAVSIVSIGAFTAIVLLAEPSSVMERWKALTTSAVPLIEQGAIRVYESEGSYALLCLLEPANMPLLRPYVGRDIDHYKSYFFSSDGRELTGRNPSVAVRDAVRRATASHQLEMADNGMNSIFAWHVHGREYAMAVEMPRGLLDSVRMDPWTWALRIGAIELVTVLICFLLARTISGPIGELRKVTRAFAAGSLDARIDEKRPWLKRCDAVSCLALDFNHMACRISEQVEEQQRLLRDISHELRSPLTRLGLAAGLLRKKTADPACLDHLARIDKEMASMKALIDNTLLAARIKEAPGEASQFVSPDDLVDDLIGDASFEAAARGVKVARAGSMTPLRANTQLLRSALDNVIRNAIRYTAPGSEVEVELSRKDGFAVIKIKDEGPGVPESSLPHLFDPFYRVEDSRDRESGGAGLGLAIAKAAIQAHNGSTQARNRFGVGLEIEIRIPLAQN